MKALVTGASSGIGLYISNELLNLGYDLFVVARDKKKLEKIYAKKKNVTIISLDLEDKDNCYKLYEMLKDKEEMDKTKCQELYQHFMEIYNRKKIQQ